MSDSTDLIGNLIWNLFSNSGKDPIVAILLVVCALLVYIIIRLGRIILVKEDIIERLHTESKEDGMKYTEGIKEIHSQQLEQVKNSNDSIGGVKLLLVEIKTLLSVMNK